MRILMSGGVKTQNIINAIEKQFKASGDEFIVVEYLDDINGIFAKGDYFDKAIIAEQSINRDYTITDEYEIRQRVNNFALECANRQRKLSYVFFTQYENIANMIYDEILPIMSSSAVVLKEPPYYATFFTSIIVNDIGQLPQDIVYVPENISVEIPVDETDLGDDPFLEMEPEDETIIPDADSDIGEDIFVNSPDFQPNTMIGDIGNDMGEDIPLEEEQMPIDDDLFGDGFDDNNNFDDMGGFDQSFNYEDNQNFDTDDSIINTEQPLEEDRSGDLPDYTIPQQDDYAMQQEDSGYIPGFDQEEEDDPFSDDIYGDSSPVNDNWEDTEQMNGYNHTIPVAPEEQGFDPLGQELYSEPQDMQPTQPQYEPQYNQQQNDMYMGGMPGQYAQEFEQSGYEPEMSGSGAEYTSTSNNARQRVGKKHRGIASLLGGRQQEDPSMIPMGAQNIGSKDIRKVKDALKPFAARGNSIVVTGCSGCGVSTVAFHLANIISQIGYTVLLVDMDTEGRTQGYISKASYDSMDTDGSNLMSAVNSSTNTNSNAVVVKTGFHLLTMGLGTDVQPIEEQLHKEKIARFVSVVKTGYNFVIYDVPFKHAINFLSDITFMCDNLVLVADASNWGITKTMLSVCNIDSDDMQDTIFHRAQLVFNRYRNLSKLFGLRVKTCDDIVQAMDRKVLDLVGDDIGLQFSRMSIAGIVNDDPMFENGWYEDVQYSDTKKGQDIFIDLIESIVLKKH